MPEGFFDLSPLPLALFIALSFIFLIQILYYLVVFRRLGWYRRKSLPAKPAGISVVICAHNEHHNLKEYLPLILEQDHPEFEVVVVNHASDDDTAYLLSDLEKRYPNLKTIEIRQDLNFFTGKKFPLSIGIRSAMYNIVLLTDADCEWIRQFQTSHSGNTEIVLGYGAYNRSSGLLNRLIRFDTAHIAIQYLSYALSGMPYMGVGRNLSYNKELFYRNNGFISHYRIRSGDDDLFINRVARKENTAIMVEPGSYTWSDPKRSFEKWVNQKRRHLSTSRHYRFRNKFMLAAYSFTLWMFYILFALTLVLKISMFPVLAIFLLRLATQYIIWSRCLRRLGEKDLLPFVLFYEIMLLLLNSGIMITNMFRKPTKWK
jgi:cellulose synthase/poly-beta-1,6-N-acetylglucosamine synthase-like glycosyltransferase